MDEQEVEQHLTEMKEADNAPEAVETPEPVEAETPEPEEAEKHVQTVPVAVHMRQREKYERQMAERDAILARGQQRLEQLIAAQQPREQPPAEDDVLGRQAWELKQIREKLESQEQREAEQRQRNDTESGLRNLVSSVKSDEARFAKTKPDYEAAVTHVKAVKRAEYMALGMSEDQAEARLYHDALAISNHAFQQGMSPAELAYNMAGALGYKKAAPASDAVKIVQMRSEGQKMAKGGGGAPASGPMTYQQLSEMSDEDFAAATEGDKWLKIAGG